MKIEYDSAKRQRTIEERGLDFQRADELLSGVCSTRADERKDYGETRWISVGTLDERVVIIVWTLREEAIRVISMRMADSDERRAYDEFLGRS